MMSSRTAGGRRLALLVGGVAVVAVGAGAGLGGWTRGNAGPAVGAVASDAERLASIVEEAWQRMLRQSPALRMKYGLPVVTLPDVGRRGAVEDSAFAARVLAELEAVGEAGLTQEERNTRALLAWIARGQVDGAEHAWFASPVTPYASPLAGVHRIFGTFAFEDGTDAERYLDLLAQYPVLVEEMHGQLRRAVARGIVLAADEVAVVVPFLGGFIAAPERGPFWVADARLSSLDAPARERVRAGVREAVTERINPGLERLRDYVAGPYAAAAPERVGLWQYPGGREYYRYLVRQNLTMDVTPEEVHETGLAEVARINAEMDRVRAELGFEGTRAEFHAFLKTDARFVPASAEAIRAKMMRHAKALEPALRGAFRTLPAAPYDARRLDPALEAGLTYGYYQVPSAAQPVGVYYFNASNLPEKSTVWHEGLTYHELVPGHHFQMALLFENEALPELRRNYYTTAYGEGWGEYSANLARELGGYADPYDYYGRLTSNLFIATRLVLDTGMNWMGWTREQAIDFMRENSLMSEPEIRSETLRYCCDIPGQALGYGWGRLQFEALRARAEEGLGAAFDLAAFHDWMLGSGPLPFDVIAARVEREIAARDATN